MVGTGRFELPNSSAISRTARTQFRGIGLRGRRVGVLAVGSDEPIPSA